MNLNFIIMKKLILISILCYNCISFAQIKNDSITHSKEVQNFIGFSPSSAKKINGLAFKYWDDENNQQQINGIEFGLNPLTIFFPFLTVIHSIPPTMHTPIAVNKYSTFKKINGIQLGIGSLQEAKINGIELNFSGNFRSITKQLSIAPTINKHYELYVLSFSVLGNFDYKVRGVQIALFNKSNNLKGVQIGLWNKNSKRSLPFINWNFKN